MHPAAHPSRQAINHIQRQTSPILQQHKSYQDKKTMFVRTRSAMSTSAPYFSKVSQDFCDPAMAAVCNGVNPACARTQAHQRLQNSTNINYMSDSDNIVHATCGCTSTGALNVPRSSHLACCSLDDSYQLAFHTPIDRSKLLECHTGCLLVLTHVDRPRCTAIS